MLANNNTGGLGGRRKLSRVSGVTEELRRSSTLEEFR